MNQPFDSTENATLRIRVMELEAERAQLRAFLAFVIDGARDRLEALAAEPAAIPDVLTVPETAKLLGKTKGAVRQMVRRKQLPKAMIGTRTGVDARAALALLAAARQGTDEG